MMQLCKKYCQKDIKQKDTLTIVFKQPKMQKKFMWKLLRWPKVDLLKLQVFLFKSWTTPYLILNVNNVLKEGNV